MGKTCLTKSELDSTQMSQPHTISPGSLDTGVLHFGMDSTTSCKKEEGQTTKNLASPHGYLDHDKSQVARSSDPHQNDGSPLVSNQFDDGLKTV